MGLFTRKIEAAADRADRLISLAFHHLIEAADAAETAIKHAASAVVHHEAAMTFHAEQREAASALHSEATQALAEVKKVLGEDVLPAAEQAVEQAAVDVVKTEL